MPCAHAAVASPPLSPLSLHLPPSGGKRDPHTLPHPFLHLPRSFSFSLALPSSSVSAVAAELAAVAPVLPAQIEADGQLRLELLSLHARGIGPGSPRATVLVLVVFTVAATRRGRFRSTPTTPAAVLHPQVTRVSSTSFRPSPSFPSPSPRRRSPSPPVAVHRPPQRARPGHRPGTAKRPAISGQCPA